MKLREHGIYRFQGREYTVTHLFTDGRPWASTALMVWAPNDDGPSDLIYLRHADGVLLGFRDFQPVGTIADLTDTERTATEGSRDVDHD